MKAVCSKNKVVAKIILDITMSLDGFIAGPNVSPQLPMGDGGLRLHDWLFGNKTETDIKILNEILETSGAVIVGGRTYYVAINDAWEGSSPFQVPAFVVSHDAPENLTEGFTFVTDGIESATAQAKAVAGNKNIWVMGGANIAQQYIETGIVDEIQIHLVSILLGEGTRLFDHSSSKQIELERTRIMESPGATHLKFRVIK
jgi:dihydrofolate reductase